MVAWVVSGADIVGVTTKGNQNYSKYGPEFKKKTYLGTYIYYCYLHIYYILFNWWHSCHLPVFYTYLLYLDGTVGLHPVRILATDLRSADLNLFKVFFLLQRPRSPETVLGLFSNILYLVSTLFRLILRGC